MTNKQLVIDLENNTTNFFEEVIEALNSGTLNEVFLLSCLAGLDRANRLSVSEAEIDVEDIQPEELENVLYVAWRDNSATSEAKKQMVDILSAGGFLVVKLDTMQQEDRVKDFLTNEIFPYYNEQAAYLF